MNVYDSDKMKDIFISHNMQPTDDYLNADFVVLNTCHIREKATENLLLLRLMTVSDSN